MTVGASYLCEELSRDAGQATKHLVVHVVSRRTGYKKRSGANILVDRVALVESDVVAYRFL